MPDLLFLPVVCATVICGASSTETEVESPEAPAAVATPQTPATPDGPTSAKLVEFDGAWQFMKMSRRLRIWRPEVGFTMTIDSDGQPVDCAIDDAFRKKYVNDKLCQVLMDHHTFEPARDEDHTAVDGVYHATLSYASLRKELD